MYEVQFQFQVQRPPSPSPLSPLLQTRLYILHACWKIDHSYAAPTGAQVGTGGSYSVGRH